jgi:predicted transcriptional regulator
VQQPKPDPFLEQLKADIQEGVDAADRGDTVPAEEVWRELHATVDEIERSSPRS